MNAETALKMAEHYGKLANIRNCRPVKVTITYKGKAETFYGIRYTSVGQYTRDMMACTHRGVEPGTEYTSERFEFASDKLPRSYKPKIRVAGHWEQRIVYRIEGDPHYWYVSGYMQTEINPEVAQYHPFGKSFRLGQWTHKPEEGREHLPITVEYLN